VIVTLQSPEAFVVQVFTLFTNVPGPLTFVAVTRTLAAGPNVRPLLGSFLFTWMVRT